MLSKLLIGNFTFILPIVFYIVTWVLVLRTINLINPKTEKRIEKSGMFFQTFKVLMYLGFSLTLLSLIVIMYNTILTKSVVYLIYSILVLLIVVFQIIYIFKSIYISVSDMELRVLNIPNISYTEDKIRNYQTSKLFINILFLISIFTFISGNLLIGMLSSKISFMVSVIMFLVLFLLTTLMITSVKVILGRIDNNLLSLEKGYISNAKLTELKTQYSLKNKTQAELKDMLEKAKGNDKGAK